METYEKTITNKTAKLAKEIGLQSPHFAYKQSDDIYFPTQSQLQTWLREEHNIIVLAENRYETISTHQMICKNDGYNVNISKYYTEPTQEEDFYDQTLYNFKTYEKALEQGLQKGLELIT